MRIWCMRAVISLESHVCNFPMLLLFFTRKKKTRIFMGLINVRSWTSRRRMASSGFWKNARCFFLPSFQQKLCQHWEKELHAEQNEGKPLIARDSPAPYQIDNFPPIETNNSSSKNYSNQTYKNQLKFRNRNERIVQEQVAAEKKNGFCFLRGNNKKINWVRSNLPHSCEARKIGSC